MSGFQTNYRTRVLTAAEFGRPADTTAYAAGDVIGPITTPAVLTFANAGLQDGGAGKVLSASVMKNSTTVTASGFALHLFNTSITPIADNAAFTLLWANRASYQGTVLMDTVPTLSASGFGTGTDMTASMGSQFLTSTAALDLWYQCSATGTSLYGVLTARAAYAPANAEAFSVRLVVEYGN